MDKKPNARHGTRWLRRATQVAFLGLFLFLFRRTDYAGADQIPYAVNVFFRWDPLAAASAMLAGRAWIDPFVPAALLIALTLILGRFFCGWVCPLGTCLDATHRLAKPRAVGGGERLGSAKYLLLAFILTAAAFGAQWVGFFDPFSILVRGLAVAVDPALRLMVSGPFDLIYRHDPLGLAAVSEPVYAFLREWALPYQQTAFIHALPSLLLLVLVFAAEKIERRFWCRRLCPLGAMLAIVARPAPLKMLPGKACGAGGCSSCIDVCRMGALDAEGRVSPESCTLCLDCVAECPKHIVSFKFKRTKAAPAPFAADRRGVVAALLAGMATPSLLQAGRPKREARPGLIRPPGARVEDEFLGRCVRCGECLKVCIKNALQPAALEAGLEGVFTPVLVPRLGYCEFNCSLCGQVCPSGAIERLALEQKQKTRIGRAYFVKDRCIPWARGVPCAVCEEMCPLPKKAIQLKEGQALNEQGELVTVPLPYVVRELCTGCGTCEYVCPLAGEAGIRVTRESESRDPESAEVVSG